MREKKAISLIVLVITILVMIILAGVVIVSLQNNNPIKKAKEASFKGDIAAFKGDLNLSLSNKIFEDTNLRREEVDELTYEGIKKYIPSFSKKYENILGIIDSELVFIGEDEDNQKWAEEVGVPVGPKPVVPPKEFIGKYQFGDNVVAYFSTPKENVENPDYTYDVTIINEGTGKGITENLLSDDDNDGKIEGGFISGSKINVKKTNREKWFYINNLIIEEGIEEIGTNTFLATSYGSVTPKIKISSIKNINFSKTLKVIEMYAFYGCNMLTSLKIGNSVTTIGDYAFGSLNQLKSVTIPDSVTEIGKHAFDLCTELTSVTIPDSVTKIGNSAFYGCKKLTSVKISNLVKTISDYTFYECEKLSSVTIPNSVTAIGEYAFEGCTALTSVTIPNSVTAIGNHAFSTCKNLTTVKIGNSVTKIEYRAFKGCTALTSVTIPNSVTTIGNSTFENCNSLKEVTYLGTKEQFNNINGKEYLNGKTIKCTNGSITN